MLLLLTFTCVRCVRALVDVCVSGVVFELLLLFLLLLLSIKSNRINVVVQERAHRNPHTWLMGAARAGVTDERRSQRWPFVCARNDR